MSGRDRERLERMAFGRPPEFDDGAEADAWAADSARARVALAEPAVRRAAPDRRRMRARLRRAAVVVGAVTVGAVAVIAAVAWISTPRYPDPLPGNELPPGYAERFGLTDVQNLVNWRDWSVMVALSPDDPDAECLIFARDGDHGFTCRPGVLRHDMFADERADITWDPDAGLTLEAEGETIRVPYRQPDR